jgi:hypothetical protein
MEKRKAIITVELVDESFLEADETITGELLEWFSEDGNVIPWIKNVKQITLKEE